MIIIARILLGLVGLALLVRFEFGQEAPKPRLIDEFTRLSCCCDLSGRIDVFLSELSSEPAAIGYIVISEPPAGTRHWRENFFDGYIRYRGFDETRVRIVRKPGVTDPLETQLWIAPSGASMAGEFAGEDSYILNATNRKIRFYDGTYDDPLCYNGPPFRLLSKYLRADTEWKANIAIGAPTKREYEAELKAVVERFEKEYGINSTRLRFFRIRGKFYNTVHEIWLVRNSLAK